MSNKLLAGHRDRLRKRFYNTPSRSLPDYEILEMILFQVFPRSDTKALAKRLLNKYGSFAKLLSADKESLTSVQGVGDSVAHQLALLHDLYSRIYLDIDHKTDVLNNWTAVLNYCRFTMGFKEKEHFRILYLNKANALIEDQLCQEGTVDRVNLYPREVLKKAIGNNASAIILIHNHPSGSVKPSKPDIEITNRIKEALDPLDIKLHDHIIVSSNNYYSFRTNGLL